MKASIEKQKAAIAQQREIVRRQLTQTRAALPPLLPPSPLMVPASAAFPPACEPIAAESVSPLVEAAGKAQELPAELIRAVIRQESQFYPCAESAKGAKGLMQLMPATVEQFGVHDPFDPRESIDAGTRYLKQLMDRYSGELPLVLGAYNAGPAVVDAAKGVPDIPETRSYVDAILQAMGKN